MSKTLKALLSEAKIKLDARKVYVRPSGNNSDTQNFTIYKQDTPIGWFANKHNMADGWAIFPLSIYDLEMLKESGVSPNMVYRVASDKGTTIVKINLKTNRMVWSDDKKFAETDKIFWEKRWVTWDRLAIDNNARAFKAFNTDGDMK